MNSEPMQTNVIHQSGTPCDSQQLYSQDHQPVVLGMHDCWHLAPRSSLCQRDTSSHGLKGQ